MSTKSKLLAMTENLQLPSDVPAGLVVDAPSNDSLTAAHRPSVTDPSAPKFPPVATGGMPRTGPGQMLQFRGQMLAVEGELGKLRERLKEHDGSAPTRAMDTGIIDPSRWANRHVASYNAPEFLRLKQDIEQAGGNIQPIAVRVSPHQAGRYEIVFGHRRHRACSELGIPVLATIVSTAVSDHELFSAMDRENRERADLSPYEQGAMYRRALDEKLYPSNRRLAESLGVSHTWVANVLLVADLPGAVIDCFKSPLDVQHRHAKQISDALETDRKAVLRRADKLRVQERPQSAAGVVALLVGKPAQPDLQTQTLKFDGKEVAHWSKDGKGRLNVRIESAYLPGDTHLAVLDAIVAVLKMDQ